MKSGTETSRSTEPSPSRPTRSLARLPSRYGRSPRGHRGGIWVRPEPGYRLLHRRLRHARSLGDDRMGARMGRRRPAGWPGAHARPANHGHAECRHRRRDRQRPHRHEPYVVGQVLASDGTVIKTTRTRSLGQAVSSDTAAKIRQAMLDVVQNGSGSAASIAGVKVAVRPVRRRPTAAPPNSTFIGFAPYDTPTLAISLVLEETTENEATAAAVAGQVLRAALAAQSS